MSGGFLNDCLRGPGGGVKAYPRVAEAVKADFDNGPRARVFLALVAVLSVSRPALAITTASAAPNLDTQAGFLV